jgi:hypothetical protein
MFFSCWRKGDVSEKLKRSKVPPTVKNAFDSGILPRIDFHAYLQVLANFSGEDRASSSETAQAERASVVRTTAS